MSIILSSQYPGRWLAPSADYPQGSGKNRTNPTSNDGSYFEKVWFDDMYSLSAAYFIASGISPNGVQDVGTASQVYDAAVNNRWNSIGNYLVGTIITASDGKQYYCNQDNGRDSSVVNPVGDATDVWREYPYKLSSDANGVAKLYWDGQCRISGRGLAYQSDGPVTFIALPVTILPFGGVDSITASHRGSDEDTNIIIDNSNTSGQTTKISLKSNRPSSAEAMYELNGRWI